MSVLAPYDLDNDDYDYREGHRWPWIVLGGLVAVLLLFGAAAIWVRNQLDPPGKPGAAVTVRVDKGMSLGDVEKLLASKGVVVNGTVFKWYVKFNGAPSVEAGDYTFHKRDSMAAALKTLKDGARSTEKPITFTVPEGLTLKEIADKVGELPGRSAEKFLEVAKSGTVRSRYEPAGSNNLEGLLLPETYFLSPGDDETAILRKMVDLFDQTADRVNLVNAAAKLKVTPYQVVIVASMVEREAKVPEDRGPIAQVIYNRLNAGMRLQIDATVEYALGEHKTSLLYSDLDVDSPYNTYKVDGLPPGPIASPGQASLEAAAQPTTGPWLYYVLSDSNGKHAFATTLDEFNRLVAEAKQKGII
jgi:UPF0755 protein